MIRLAGGYYNIDDLSEREEILGFLERACSLSKQDYDNGLISYYLSNPQLTDVDEYGEGFDVHFTLLVHSALNVTESPAIVSHIEENLYCGITVYE